MANRNASNGGRQGGLERAVAGGGLSAATQVVGVIGHPVAHSMSPLLHNTAFHELGLDWVSVGFPVSPDRTALALAGALTLSVRGLSVTMPHKEAAAAVVDDLAAEAARLGAVNCVVAVDGGWRGENTDGAGFLAALARDDRFTPSGARCLVVGAGGAARAVIAALGDAGAAEVVVVNRTAERARTAAVLAGAVGRVGAAEEATGCDLVVNATPAGMGDIVSRSAGWPVEPGLLRSGQVVVDLVYHPPLTPWLAAAAEQGAITRNGLGMLVHQAALQIGHWTGQVAPVEAMWQAVASPEHDEGLR
jgi:shikimate dehydrogenase